MPKLRYLRKVISTGAVDCFPFKAEHFGQVGLQPNSLGGMPQLEAYQLVNRMNLEQDHQQYVYGLE